MRKARIKALFGIMMIVSLFLISACSFGENPYQKEAGETLINYVETNYRVEFVIDRVQEHSGQYIGHSSTFFVDGHIKGHPKAFASAKVNCEDGCEIGDFGFMPEFEEIAQPLNDNF